MPAFRRSLRLPDYDYTQPGAYFVTLVAQGRVDRFGQIANGEVILTPAGEMLRDVWLALSDRFPQIELDEFVIMPNHFHGIVIITDYDRAGENRAGTRPAPTKTSDPVGAPLVGARDTNLNHFDLAGEDLAGHSPAGGRSGSPAPTETSDPVGAPTRGAHAATAPTLGQIIGAYKSITTHEYILGVNHQNWPALDRRLWQRNYYEHILRSDANLDHVRAYIHENPRNWDLDDENPAIQTRTN